MQIAEILIISDVEGKRYIYYSALRRLGLRCYTAQSIPEAEAHFMLSQKIKLVLLFLTDSINNDIGSLNSMINTHFKKSTILILVGDPNGSVQSLLYNAGHSPAFRALHLPSSTGIQSVITHVQQQLNTH